MKEARTVGAAMAVGRMPGTTMALVLANPSTHQLLAGRLSRRLFFMSSTVPPGFMLSARQGLYHSVGRCPCGAPNKCRGSDGLPGWGPADADSHQLVTDRLSPGNG